MVNDDEFVARYPRLWHLAHGDAWDGISRRGLMSTQRLVELFEPDEAETLLSVRRADSHRMEHPEYGTAVIRDQEPLDVEKLAGCLDGLTVDGWFRLLNSFVFLFAREDHLVRMRDKYVKQHPVVVLRLRTDSLVRAHGEFLRVATINTGYTDRKPVRRGVETFTRIPRFDLSKWARIQEVVVPGEIPDVLPHLDEAYLKLPDGSQSSLL